jgi:hypothetical protein
MLAAAWRPEPVYALLDRLEGYLKIDYLLNMIA